MKARSAQPRALTWLGRALGLDRNPLRRDTDRAEAWTTSHPLSRPPPILPGHRRADARPSGPPGHARHRGPAPRGPGSATGGAGRRDRGLRPAAGSSPAPRPSASPRSFPGTSAASRGAGSIPPPGPPSPRSCPATLVALRLPLRPPHPALLSQTIIIAAAAPMPAATYPADQRGPDVGHVLALIGSAGR